MRDRGRVRRGARPAAVRTGSAKPDRETEYFAVYRMCTVCTIQRTASSTERRRMAHRRVHERHTHSLSRSHTDGRPSLPPGPARCRLMNHDRPPARRLSCCGGSPAHRSSLTCTQSPSLPHYAPSGLRSPCLDGAWINGPANPLFRIKNNAHGSQQQAAGIHPQASLNPCCWAWLCLPRVLMMYLRKSR